MNQLVYKYLHRTDWRINENSNTVFSLQGLNNFLTEKAIKDFWLKEIYASDIAKAHIRGDMHIHDLGTLGAYCVGHDLQQILLDGFKGVPGKIVSKPPKHLRTALLQSVNFLYTIQGETAGAQAFSNFDTYLAPFIYYDRLSCKEVAQCVQEFLYNMNVPTRVGFRSPFTNITLDLTPPKFIREQGVIRGGELMDESYDDFADEMNIFNKALIKVMGEGDANNRPFTFPIPTYNITKDFPWDSTSLRGLWNITAKYGIPYFSNFINSDMEPEDAQSMCCRLRLDQRELRKRGGGLFGANPKTGSLGVVTINMPRIGFFARNYDMFYEKLEEVMNLAKESLITKRKAIERLTQQGLHPYIKYYFRDVKKRYGEYWKNHFSTIGLVGMNEAIVNFLGTDIGTPDGQTFAMEVLDYMRKKLADYQEDTGDIWNLEATPAESTAYRLARLDRKHFPKIRIYNQEVYGGQVPYYTNSTQLPVGYTSNIAEALSLQDEMQAMYTGGTVHHVFLGEAFPNLTGLKKLVRRIAEGHKLPYFTITPTFSICRECGYLPGEEYSCQKCGEVTEVYSRIVGYLTPVSQWNEGKAQEFKDRKAFDPKSF